MKITSMFNDEHAVSPVIGVILMVAITVILAAVIGTFVLGLGDQVQSQSPQVTWEFSTSPTSATCNVNTGGTYISVTHAGGDSVSSDNIEFKQPSGSQTDVTANCYSSTTTTLSAGSSLDLQVTSGETLRIVWTNPDSDKTSVIGSYEVP